MFKDEAWIKLAPSCGVDYPLHYSLGPGIRYDEALYSKTRRWLAIDLKNIFCIIPSLIPWNGSYNANVRKVHAVEEIVDCGAAGRP